MQPLAKGPASFQLFLEFLQELPVQIAMRLDNIIRHFVAKLMKYKLTGEYKDMPTEVGNPE